MALFEITPVFGKTDIQRNNDNVANVLVHYRHPLDSTLRLSKYNCAGTPTEFEELPVCHQFAASVVMFASLLKESKYAKRYSWNDVILLAQQSHDPKDPLQAEFVSIIEKAKKIYLRNRRKPK